jgi:hypothetical protein
VLLVRKVLAAILKAILARLFVGSRPFSQDLVATDAIVRTQPQPGDKVILAFPFAHIISGFADDRRRGHHIDAVDPG